MRAIILTIVFLLSSVSLFSQQRSTWYRVYTFDESVIEMNTSKVTFGPKDVARVRFRWTFERPEVLQGEPQITFKSRVEVIECNCSLRRYRLYENTLFDSAGKVVRREAMNPTEEWRGVTSGSMMDRLLTPACELVERRTHPPVATSDAKELEKVAQYALSFSQSLEQAKDFKPIIEKFFAADYLNRYLRDQNTNWFLNLSRETAAKASRAELQRFHVALLNSGYFSFVYLVSQYPYAADGAIPEEKLVPPDVLELIDSHPYSAKYKGKQDNNDFLAENIDSVERLRSYTDLLEGIGALMRKHVISASADQSREYRKMLEQWDLYQPRGWICVNDCLGLPKGTKIFDIDVLLFHLQIAEVKGALKVISALDSSR